MLRRLPCGHSFHRRPFLGFKAQPRLRQSSTPCRGCIDKWLKRNKAGYSGISTVTECRVTLNVSLEVCPLCLQDIEDIMLLVSPAFVHMLPCGGPTVAEGPLGKGKGQLRRSWALLQDFLGEIGCIRRGFLACRRSAVGQAP